MCAKVAENCAEFWVSTLEFILNEGYLSSVCPYYDSTVNLTGLPATDCRWLNLTPERRFEMFIYTNIMYVVIFVNTEINLINICIDNISFGDYHVDGSIDQNVAMRWLVTLSNC